MSTLKTKIGEIELKPGALCESSMEDLVKSLIDVWEISPELIDIERMSNYFKPVSPEWLVEYASRYTELGEVDFVSYGVINAIAKKFEVMLEDRSALLSANWWKAFSIQYKVNLTKEIVDFYRYHNVDLSPYME